MAMASASASLALRLAKILSPLGGVGAASGLRVYGPLDAAAGSLLPALRPTQSAPARFFASKPWKIRPYYRNKPPYDLDGWSQEQLYLRSQDPKGRILPDGCDSEHWVIVMDPPASDLTREEIVAIYVSTLATVFGSPKKARERMYSVSTSEYFAFGAHLSEKQARRLRKLPNVQWVLPDKYLEVKNDDYGDFKGRTAWCGEIGEDGLPTWVDWRIRGAVTPVQDQLISGPCWAFSAIGSVEAANFNATGKRTKLSEQQLIDCNDVTNDGCNSGLIYEALEYVKRNGGVASADVYPYLAKKCKCRNITTDLVTISGIAGVVPDCEKELKKAVSKRPVCTAIEIYRGYKQYSGGILRGPNSSLLKCCHAGLLIGYDRLNKTKVWTFKDSTGTKPPHGGIKYIVRDAYPEGGALGIARYCMYATKKWPNRVGPVRSETAMGVKPKLVDSLRALLWGDPEDDASS